MKFCNCKFNKELINFFKGTVCGSADSVKALIEIQERFPEEYEKIRNMKIDPNQIDELMKNMTDRQKEIFFIVFTKASFLGKKLSMLFDLSLDEKKSLTKELNDFAIEVEKKLTELNE